MNLDRLFNRKNEPGRRTVEKAGRANLSIRQAEETEIRESLVKFRLFTSGDMDLIKELQDPEKGNLRVSKDERGKDVIKCRYLGREFEARIDDGRRVFLMDGKIQDVDDKQNRHKLADFRDKLEKYSAFLKEQEYIPERAMKNLTDRYGGSLKWKLSEEDRNIAMRAIDDFLGRSE